MTEGGDFDKLGRGAIWNGQIAPCIHQNHIFRVRLDRAQVLPGFFANLLLTQYAKAYFLTASKQTTNLATINMTQLKRFLFRFHLRNFNDDLLRSAASTIAFMPSSARLRARRSSCSPRCWTGRFGGSCRPVRFLET